MFVVTVDTRRTVNIKSYGITATAGNVIGHLTVILALVFIRDLGQAESFLMTKSNRSSGRVLDPSVGGERVGFGVTSELDRVSIV